MRECSLRSVTHHLVLGKREDKLNFKLADIDIKTTEKTCLLGVVLDNELKFDNHISSICHKVSAQMSALNLIQQTVNSVHKYSC